MASAASPGEERSEIIYSYDNMCDVDLDVPPAENPTCELAARGDLEVANGGAGGPERDVLAVLERLRDEQFLRERLGALLLNGQSIAYNPCDDVQDVACLDADAAASLAAVTVGDTPRRQTLPNMGDTPRRQTLPPCYLAAWLAALEEPALAPFVRSELAAHAAALRQLEVSTSRGYVPLHACYLREAFARLSVGDEAAGNGSSGGAATNGCAGLPLLQPLLPAEPGPRAAALETLATLGIAVTPTVESVLRAVHFVVEDREGGLSPSRLVPLLLWLQSRVSEQPVVDGRAQRRGADSNATSVGVPLGRYQDERRAIGEAFLTPPYLKLLVPPTDGDTSTARPVKVTEAVWLEGDADAELGDVPALLPRHLPLCMPSC